MLGLSGRRAAAPDVVRAARGAVPEVRRKAAEELAASAEPWAPGELVRLLADAHGLVREAARAGLRRHGPAAGPALVRGVDHPDPAAAAAAAELLGELRPAGGVERLVTALKFSARPVQLAAKRGLAGYGAVARPILAAERDRAEPWVRHQIDDLLATLPAAAESGPAPLPPAAPPGPDWSAGWPDPAAEPVGAGGPGLVPVRVGRWVETWGVAVLILVAVITFIALFAGGR
ncbi:MAG TPA: hypothetical protein VKD90_29415 [Gemmataceae bacterium]|nr:hypothetical protein [Gemmataceae bacterium]